MPDKKSCFVISPIGGDDSPIRIAADWFLEFIVCPALEHEFAVKRADAYEKADIITNQIIHAIRDADLIVADLTDHNANVHYELGVAHAMSKPVIPMISKGQRPPFDNSAMRTIPYATDRPIDIRNAVAALRASASAAFTGDVQNPVTIALGVAKLKDSPDSRDQVVANLVEQVQTLSKQMLNLREGMGVSRPVSPSIIADLFRDLGESKPTVTQLEQRYAETEWRRRALEALERGQILSPPDGPTGLFGFGSTVPPAPEPPSQTPRASPKTLKS